MTKIIACVNQKGGVGKTTTVVNLAAALSKHKLSVLVVDLDPQGNASTGFGVDIADRTDNSYDVITGEKALKKCISKTAFTNISLVPANIDLSGADIEISDFDNREQQLKNQLGSVADKYDYIIIDCPPSLGLLTINALVAADSLVIPLQCEFYALEGLAQLFATYERVKKHLNPGLGIEGVLLTMYDARNRLTDQVEQEVRDYLGDRVFDVVIPRNVRISEAPSHGQPVIFYDKYCPGALAYDKLAKELIT